jgi:translin
VSSPTSRPSPPSPPSRADELNGLVESVRADLAAVHAAREEALRACRATIQACSQAIRAIHREDRAAAGEFVAKAQAALQTAQQVLVGHPALAAVGFLHDAEKEFAEARLFGALIDGAPLPAYTDIAVAPAAWLNGLAEATSELRRHLLDRLRAGDLGRAEAMLTTMDDAYGALITVDFPDAVTGGLRRTTDALRAVLERTRSDLTTTVLQARLQAAISERLPPA